MSLKSFIDTTVFSSIGVGGPLAVLETLEWTRSGPPWTRTGPTLKVFLRFEIWFLCPKFKFSKLLKIQEKKFKN